MEKLTVEEALVSTVGTSWYQRRLVGVFAVGQVAITFLVMGIPMMFPEFEMVCDKMGNCKVPEEYERTASAELGVFGEERYKVAYIGTAYFVGMMIFALGVSWASDSRGRKTVVFFSSIICSILIFTIAVSWKFYLVVFSYFLFGGAELGVYCSGFILLTESVEPSKRNLYSGLGLCSWGVASIFLMILFMLGLYWRMIILISFTFMFTYIFLLNYTCESPRWLSQNSSPAEAKKVLNYMAQTNGLVKFDYDLKSDSSGTKTSHSYLIFLQNKDLFKTIFLCILIWMSIVLVYYSMIFLLASFIENVYIEGLVMAVGETLATLFVCYFVNVIGRRQAAILCFVTSAAAFFLIGMIPVGQGWFGDFCVLVLSFFARAAVSGEFNLFYIYIAELFPTSVRNMAFGLCNNIGRLGGIASSNIPMICKATGIRAPFLLGTILLSAAFLSSFLEETLNKDLKDSVANPKNVFQELDSLD